MGRLPLGDDRFKVGLLGGRQHVLASALRREELGDRATRSVEQAMLDQCFLPAGNCL
jgi:hypothetical protein